MSCARPRSLCKSRLSYATLKRKRLLLFRLSEYLRLFEVLAACIYILLHPDAVYRYLCIHSGSENVSILCTIDT